MVLQQQGCLSVSLLCGGIWKFMKILRFIWIVILHNTTQETKTEQHDNPFKKAFIMIDNELLKVVFYRSRLQNIFSQCYVYS